MMDLNNIASLIIASKYLEEAIEFFSEYSSQMQEDIEPGIDMLKKSVVIINEVLG